MPKVLVFAERMLPSTQTFIPLQVKELKRYRPRYAGLIPADRNYPLTSAPILLAANRSRRSRVRRELYRWTGYGPHFHRELARAEPQLIHAHFAEGSSAAVAMSRQLNLPLLVHLRGGAEVMSERELRRHMFEWPFLAFRRQLWRRASGFLCVSQYILDKALKAGFPAEKLRVQYTGMHCEAFTPKLAVAEKDPNLIIYVGRLVPYKGCDYLLRAVARVQKRHLGARLLVIGDGHFRPALESLARELQVNALFLGEQPQSVIRPWLEKARVFCGPSVTVEGGMSEAFGNVFSEAQSMGVPVVSFRHGGIPETMQEGVTGLLAPERDTDRLAEHLERFLVDEEFWARAREQGMTWVREKFSVERQTEKLELLYDRAIEQFEPKSFAQRAVRD
jgi:colanic acid/amylovoran biosynthesis glycosyltransferase